MGTDKALLTWKHKTFLQNCFQNLTDGGTDYVVVASGSDLNHYNYLPYPCQSDLIEGSGPLGAMYSMGIKYFYLNPNIEKFYLKVIPVDMPLMSAKLLTELKPDNDYHVIKFTNYELPALIEVTYPLVSQIGLLLENAPQNLKSFKYLFSQLKVKELSFDNNLEVCFKNLNSPEEYAQATANKEANL